MPINRGIKLKRNVIIDKIIEDTEAVVTGSATNIGVGDQLITQSHKVSDEIENLLTANA